MYKIELATKKVTALATRADGWPFCFPDDVDIDDQGNVYMSDLTYAGIWKISPDGKKVDLWSADPLLNWSPQPYSGFPLGRTSARIWGRRRGFVRVGICGKIVGM